MKRVLLVLGILFLSFSRMIGATDIGDVSKVTSIMIVYNDTYTGAAITSSFFLTGVDTPIVLNEGTDYTVQYLLNGNTVNGFKDAGTYTIVISGIGSYTGQITISHLISPAIISDVAVSGLAANYPYTGSQITPTFDINLNGISILPSEYSISFGDNKDVATGGSIVLNPTNTNFVGSKTINFSITPIDISSATTVTTLNPTSYSYTGSAITPTIESVTVNGNTLTSSDYTVNAPSPGTNTAVGNASVTITGTGNYTGSATQPFTITATDLTPAVVTLNPDTYTYTGSLIIPIIESVVLNGTTLVLNTDYIINTPPNDGENIDVGPAKISVTGIGSYSGFAEQYFTIIPVTLTQDMFTAIATKTYTGSAITLVNTDIATSYNSKALTLGTDFTISGYIDNIEAGTASVTFNGAGNFTGQVNMNFEIDPEPLIANMFSVTDKAFTGSAVELVGADITANDGVQALTLGTDFDIQSYANNINAGTASVVFLGKGDYKGTVPVSFNITAQPLSADMFTIADKGYTGSAVELIASDITASFNSIPLTLGTDFTLGTYTNNINQGIASVVITGKGNYSGSITANFNISSLALTANMFTITNKVFTGSAVDLTSSDITANNGGTPLVFGTDYTLGAYTNNTSTGTATVTINGAGNYSGSVTINFSIVSNILTADLFTSIADKSYTGAAVTLTAQDIVTSLVLGTDYTISFYNNNINAGIASVVFNGIGDYSGTTEPIPFTINPSHLTQGMIHISNEFYTGQLILPQPLVVVDKAVLLNTNYTVTYPDGLSGDNYIEAGTYHVRVEAVPNGNLTGFAIVTFDILPVPKVHHTITIPVVAGVTTDPVAGTYNVTDGDYFSFYLSIDSLESSLRAGIEPTEDIIVKANGVEMNPIYKGNNRYLMTVTNIKEDIIIEIILKDSNPTGNNIVESDQVKVFSSDRMLHIESGEAATINVYNVTGQLEYKGSVDNNSVTTVPLSQGIYLVRVNNKTFKVIVK